MAKNNSNSNKKSGGAGFIITLLILAAVTNFSFTGIIAGVLLGLGIGKITSIMGSGLDTTTHNSRDRAREAQEAEQARRNEEAARVRLQQEAEQRKKEEASTIPLTGDKVADQVITTGQEMLRTITKENAAIPDRELTDLMNNLSIKCMQERGVSYGEMKEARETTIRGMNLILTACQKQIDNLHRDNMLDISTDIDVLEQMLKRDGFTDNEIVETARTAAEAQMRATSAPVMDFPADKGKDVSAADAPAAKQLDAE